MNFVSATDLLGPDWRFLAPVNSDPDIQWTTHSGLPKNTLERLVKRPALARYRAALAACRAAKRERQSVLVSHLPNMAAATNLVRRTLCQSVPQIAFSFNFTELPQAGRRRCMAAALRGIDEFVVFSRFEQKLYADHFNIPLEAIQFLPWAMETPMPGPENPVDSDAPYLCAIGGEGRDYALLADAMRAHPTLRMVIVARPYSIAGIAFPANVQVFTNLPAPQTWRIAADSLGMIVPLRSDTTACGHITIVGAQLLGIPVIATRSTGIEDYVEDCVTANLVPAGDSVAMIDGINKLQSDRPGALAQARAASERANSMNSLSVWSAYFDEIKRRFAA